MGCGPNNTSCHLACGVCVCVFSHVLTYITFIALSIMNTNANAGFTMQEMGCWPNDTSHLACGMLLFFIYLITNLYYFYRLIVSLSRKISLSPFLMLCHHSGTIPDIPSCSRPFYHILSIPFSAPSTPSTFPSFTTISSISTSVLTSPFLSALCFCPQFPRFCPYPVSLCYSTFLSTPCFYPLVLRFCPFVSWT